MPSSVAIESVTVLAPGGQAIVRDLSLTLEPGEAVALIGRSGAGKTTILRLLNGLATPASGRVLIDGQPLTGGLAVRRRRIGTILQSPALFPHRTVFDNIATVPRLAEWDESRISAAIERLLSSLGMPGERFARRFPRSLSGGEQQRVAIARAMIAKPELLLCDEPFNALDPLVRRELQDVFLSLVKAGGVTVVFVTHDLPEALRVALRIVLIDGGEIVTDASRERFLSSELPLVRRFIEAARIPEAS